MGEEECYVEMGGKEEGYVEMWEGLWRDVVGGGLCRDGGRGEDTC